jgi:transcriptional regulator with XRE-family HTH domain
MEQENASSKRVRRMHELVESVCGLYSRVARRLRVSPSLVSRVARGERRSEPVEKALSQQFNEVSAEILRENPTPAGEG